jgi:hypothetical protein
VKTVLGDAFAAIRPPGSSARTQYRKIGVAFRDDTTGQISLKIDTLPLPQEPWTGWVNVFEKRPHADSPPYADLPSSDVPF